MAMNREVFLSLLAMDAYNRGVGALVGDLENIPNVSRVGTATVRTDSDRLFGQDAVSAGFYAIAYEWNNNGINETVISYRGTNFPDLSNVTEEAFKGFAPTPRPETHP